MNDTNHKLQYDTLDSIKPALDKAKIKWVFIFDEDILQRLDGDERLARLTPESLERIKEEAIEGIMESFTYNVDNAINSELGN
jgi:hypothetical protein